MSVLNFEIKLYMKQLIRTIFTIYILALAFCFLGEQIIYQLSIQFVLKNWNEPLKLSWFLFTNLI